MKQRKILLSLVRWLAVRRMEITAKSAHRSVQWCVVKQDKKEEMNFMFGVLLGSLQTILDENIELIATIERR